MLPIKVNHLIHSIFQAVLKRLWDVLSNSLQHGGDFGNPAATGKWYMREREREPVTVIEHLMFSGSLGPLSLSLSLSLSILIVFFHSESFWHVCQVIIALKPRTHGHIVAKNALTKSDKTVVLLCLSLPGRLWNLKVYLRVRELFQILQLLSDTFQCLPPINSIHHSSMVSVLASCKHG